MRPFVDNDIVMGRVYRVQLIPRVGYYVFAHRIRYGGPLLSPAQADWFYNRLSRHDRDSALEKAHNKLRTHYELLFKRVASRMGLTIKVNSTFNYVTLEHRDLVQSLGASSWGIEGKSRTLPPELEVAGELNTQDNDISADFHAWKRLTHIIDQASQRKIAKTYGRILMRLVV